MTREVYDVELDSILTREEREFQVREYNYVFKLSVRDTETGEIIYQDEYRTIASDEQLNLDDAKAQLAELIETTGT